MNPLEPGQLWVFRIHAWIGAAIVLAVASAAEIVNAFIDLIPSGLVLPAVLILLIYPALIAPGRLYRSWGWKIDAEELHLQRGIWTKVETIVPFRRVQHIDVSQPALDRAFGVCRLVLHTAGTQDFRVTLPGLSRETAEEIRDAVRAVIAREADER